ncbi:OmpH family outer membrane protein [Paludibacter sp. 221]|uniref:OmpH family outer membrane protein n=1 Tax=Paludibacter sp. 221 TaxID=2302939 RepID=UPI0013D020F4|nr:OmpH family outer membrane protein [Paludibacter sp. 221]NDV46154.1 OmpH family outer membrane protein [Paludibacter sp. 221]
MKKIVLLFLLSVSTSFVFSQQFAYISRDSILTSIDDYNKNLLQLDSLKTNYTQELDYMQEQLKQRYNQLLAPYGLTGQESIEDIQSTIEPMDSITFSILLQEDQMLQTKAKSYDNMLNFVFHRDIQPLLDKVNKTITSYSKKNKIDIVYIIEELSPGLAYINEKKNITGEIIKLLKE